MVATITCNITAKAAAGIGDNLLSSELVAWKYHKKPAFFCPACNVDMWNNMPTQPNVGTLKPMGIETLGPRLDRLINGQVGIGCMERVDTIIARYVMVYFPLCVSLAGLMTVFLFRLKTVETVMLVKVINFGSWFSGELKRS